MPGPDRLGRLIRRYLAPWYDEDDAAQARERSEAIRQRSIAARIRSEHVRDAYAKSSARLGR